MSKLGFLSAIIHEINCLIQSAAEALEYGDEQKAEELIEDVAKTAIKTAYHESEEVKKDK